MNLAAVSGAVLQCTLGTGPATLSVVGPNPIMAESKPMASIMDNKPMMNIPDFKMCNISSPPAPCTPLTASMPWMNGSDGATVNGCPAVTNASKLVCTKGGLISVASPGQSSVTL